MTPVPAAARRSVEDYPSGRKIKVNPAALISITPLEDRVVIEPFEAEERSPGGIVLPDAARERPQRGRVLAVGPGRMLDNGDRKPIGVEIGDVVLFTKYSGEQMEVDGREVRIVLDRDILAKVN